jgi:hypothetical protein
MWILPTAVLGWSLTPWLGVDALGPARVGAQIVLDLAHLLAALPRPSAEAVVAAAGLALLGFAATVVFSSRGWARGLTRRGAVPPWLASSGLLLVVWMRWGDPVPNDWFALGGRRSISIVAPATHGRHVCIREPRSSPAFWSSLLRGLDIDRVGAVVAAAPDPAVTALREALDARRMLDGDEDDCIDVDVERARSLLTRCLERRGARRGIIRGSVGDSGEPAAVHCFAAGRWRLLASEAE